MAIGQLFPVVPANGLGFKSLMSQWAGFEHFTPAYWQMNSPEYRWLGATALYPKLYYELTRLYVDDVITKNLKLSEWEQNRRW